MGSGVAGGSGSAVCSQAARLLGRMGPPRPGPASSRRRGLAPDRPRSPRWTPEQFAKDPAPQRGLLRPPHPAGRLRCQFERLRRTPLPRPRHRSRRCPEQEGVDRFRRPGLLARHGDRPGRQGPPQDPADRRMESRRPDGTSHRAGEDGFAPGTRDADKQNVGADGLGIQPGAELRDLVRQAFATLSPRSARGRASGRTPSGRHTRPARRTSAAASDTVVRCRWSCRESGIATPPTLASA